MWRPLKVLHLGPGYISLQPAYCRPDPLFIPPTQNNSVPGFQKLPPHGQPVYESM
jgi:hypothetical protein